MKIIRSTRLSLSGRSPRWQTKAVRSGKLGRGPRRASRREQQGLGFVLVVGVVLGLWWSGQHLLGGLLAVQQRFTSWLHEPLAWLVLGLMFLALVGLLVLLWWGLHRLRQRIQARAAAQRLRLEQLAAVEPLAFEHLVGHLFEQEGYQVTVTKASGDNGVDLWVRQPGQPAIPVQCKRYRSTKVGSPELQTFSGALRFANAREGIFVTTARFTPTAIAWAKQEHIRLIDGLALAEWQRRLELRSVSLAGSEGFSGQRPHD